MRYGLMAIVAVLGAALGVEAAVLCAKKSGVVVLRDETCKRKETQIDPVALGLRGPQGEQGARGEQGPEGEQGPPGADGSARAYGEVAINDLGEYELVEGTSKNVVAVTQGGGGNSAACIELDASIDASTAIVLAISNLRTGATTEFNTQVLTSRPLGYCSGGNIVEVITTTTNGPGAATKRAFHFAVM